LWFFTIHAYSLLIIFSLEEDSAGQAAALVV
jgi:hypothetical protein